MPHTLHINLISYEYPPHTAAGGITAYVKQAAVMPAGREHDAEVFAAGQSGGTHDFSERIAPLLAVRHRAAAFDVPEGPEYRAEARDDVRLVPDIPLVVKLHTLSCLLRSMSTALYSPAQRTLPAAKSLLQNPAERMELGASAWQRV